MGNPGEWYTPYCPPSQSRCVPPTCAPGADRDGCGHRIREQHWGARRTQPEPRTHTWTWHSGTRLMGCKVHPSRPMGGRAAGWRRIKGVLSSTVQGEARPGAAGRGQGQEPLCTWLLSLGHMGAQLLPGLAGGDVGPVCIHQGDVYRPCVRSILRSLSATLIVSEEKRLDPGSQNHLSWPGLESRAEARCVHFSGRLSSLQD